MDNSVRPAIRNEWYHSVLDRLDQFCIRNFLKYSKTFFIFLAYHSMFSTFFSTLIIFVNAASNPCHGYLSLQSFQARDIFSVLLSVSGFLCSWRILYVLDDSKPKSESSQRNHQLMYCLFLVTTIVGTFLAFCLFMFIISEGHFLYLWRLILDAHTLQIFQYFSHNQLTCFKKLELVQLGVLSFYVVAGGVSIICLLCHKSLWRLVTPSEEEPLQVINRAPEEFSQYYSYYPPEVIPVGYINAESYDDDLTPPQPPNRQSDIVSALVHSALAPDVIPYPPLEIAEDRIQQCSQSVDKTLEGALADAQSDMNGKNESSAAIDADSAPRPPHLADMGSNGHLYWIDELKRYLAMSADTNCEVLESTDVINLPLVDAHSISCGNGLENIPQQQRSASVSPLSSSPYSRREIKEQLSKIFEVHISKQASSRSSRYGERRGAISGPSGGSAFDECEDNDGDKTETFVQPLASISSTKSQKQTTKKQMSSPRPRYHRSPPPMDLAKSCNGASFFSTRGSYQTRSEFSGAFGSPQTEDNSKKKESQEIQRQNQQSVPMPLGFSQIGGDTRGSRTGVLSSDSDECRCTDVSAHSWFGHFGAVHQVSKTRALSSDSGESEYQKLQENTHSAHFRGSDGSSSHEFRSYSFIGDSGRSECLVRQSGNAHQFGGTADVSATGVSFGGTDETGSPKQVSSEPNTNSASLTVNVTSQRVEYKNQRSQQPYSSKLKSTEGQTPESRDSDFKSNQSSGALVIQIDSDNVDDHKVIQSKEFEHETIPFADYGNRGEDHPSRRPNEVVSLELGHPSLAPIPPVASPDGSDKPVQKNSQHQSSNTHSDPSSFAAVIQPKTCTISQIVTSDALLGKLPNGKARDNQFQPESTSSSEPHSLSIPKLVSNENKSDEQCSGRRDSRTFAMDLDNIDESSQSEGSDEEYSGHQENRSRHSSESTDSGLFLDNLFYTDNDDVSLV